MAGFATRAGIAGVRLLHRDVARIAGETLGDGWDLVLFMEVVRRVNRGRACPTHRRLALGDKL